MSPTATNNPSTDPGPSIGPNSDMPAILRLLHLRRSMRSSAEKSLAELFNPYAEDDLSPSEIQEKMNSLEGLAKTLSGGIDEKALDLTSTWEPENISVGEVCGSYTDGETANLRQTTYRHARDSVFETIDSVLCFQPLLKAKNMEDTENLLGDVTSRAKAASQPTWLTSEIQEILDDLPEAYAGALRETFEELRVDPIGSGEYKACSRDDSSGEEGILWTERVRNGRRAQNSRVLREREEMEVKICGCTSGCSGGDLHEIFSVLFEIYGGDNAHGSDKIPTGDNVEGTEDDPEVRESATSAGCTGSGSCCIHREMK